MVIVKRDHKGRSIVGLVEVIIKFATNSLYVANAPNRAVIGEVGRVKRAQIHLL